MIFKKMAKIFFVSSILMIFILAVSSCHNMCSDLEKYLGAKPWYENLTWEDKSEDTYSFSGNNNFTMDGTTIVATGTSGYINNWVISNNKIKGFEAEIKLTSNSRYSGFQIFEGNSYRKYNLYINSNGDFYIQYDPWKYGPKVEQLYIKKTAVNPNEFNTVKAELREDRSTAVYLNGEHCFSIPDHQFTYGTFCIATCTKGSGTTAYFKIHSVQH